MNRTALAIRMLQLLSIRGNRSVKELANILETNPRNIPELRKELETAGYNIEGKTGRNGGYSLMEPFCLPVAGFTEDEIQSLSALNKLVSEDLNFIYRKELRGVLTKIMAGAHILQSDPVFIANSQGMTMDSGDYQKIYRTLHVGISNRVKVIIKYQSYNSNKSPDEIRTVAPYKLVRFNDDWYVIGKEDSDDLIKLFKLVRIRAIKDTDVKFTLDPSFDESDFISKHALRIVGPAIRIKLKVYEPYARSLSERPSGENPVITPLKDSILFETTLHGDYSIRKFILGMGSGCVVLEPDEVISMIGNEVNEIKNYYFRQNEES